MVPWIDGDAPFPPTSRALGPDSDAPGLLAAGGRLTPQRLEQAYRRGIFPWFSAGQPVLWWSPDPRMVLPVADFRVTRSFVKVLRRFVRTPGCEVRIDTAFERVIDACARTPRPGQPGTWIVPPMVRAYTAWHRASFVHSVETWAGGELVGGLYGVAIGRMFFGESMFAHATDASKIALAALVCFCRAQGVTLIDCQQATAHLASLGARPVPREAFERHLARACGEAPIADWTYDPSQWLQLPALRPTDPEARA
jgi:leucyl/phenylalanyl-tRNA--protein transferase